jgi:glycine/D-amino acid oxidase-like deaminating enzyme
VSGLDIPDTVNAGDVPSWSDEVDVVVIGFGIAGGSAAVSAAAAGARVLLLERAAAAGGTTSQAGGHFYLGGGTAVQQATGHEDSADEMYKYLVAVSREPEHDKIRAYCDVRATKRCGRSANRRNRHREGTPYRYRVNSVARPWSSTYSPSGPTKWVCRSATRPG